MCHILYIHSSVVGHLGGFGPILKWISQLEFWIILGDVFHLGPQAYKVSLISGKGLSSPLALSMQVFKGPDLMQRSQVQLPFFIGPRPHHMSLWECKTKPLAKRTHFLLRTQPIQTPESMVSAFILTVLVFNSLFIPTTPGLPLSYFEEVVFPLGLSQNQVKTFFLIPVHHPDQSHSNL